MKPIYVLPGVFYSLGFQITERRTKDFEVKLSEYFTNLLILIYS